MHSNIKVLIADDEPNILLSLEFLFKKEGYKVFIARDGAEAFDLINTNHPDIVILDIMMPRMDGYEVCKYIKSSDEHKNTKVVFMSAKSKEADINKGLDLGAEFYIPKPFSTRELVGKISSLALNVS